MTGAATRPDDGRGSLWLIAAGPAVWALHFLLCYVTAAIWCAKVAGRAGELGGARTAIAAYTLVALAAVAAVCWQGLVRHRRVPREAAPHEEDTPEDRERFVGLATLMLASLSAVAIAYVALAAVFIGSCR